MIITTERFLEKINKSKRQVLGMVKVYWTDPFFLKDSSNYNVSSPYTLEGCHPQQIFDDSKLLQEDIRKWFHFDDATPLSAGLYPAPDNLQAAMAERGRVGWYGNINSDAGGTFTPEMVLTVSHAEKTVFDIVVTGDEAYREYPVDFKVRLYSDGGYYTFDVKGNNLITWRGVIPDDVKALIRGNGSNFDYRYVTEMELIITKWSKSNRVAKITTFTAINEMIFTGADIFNMSLLEELEVNESELPIGTVSANEIDITFNNISDKFYVGRADTELANVLIPNRKMLSYIGVKLSSQVYEWVPLGVTWSQGWNITESSESVSVTARDRMELLRQMRYLGHAVEENITLYDLSVDVLESARAKMPDLKYNVDEELKSIAIPQCYLPVSDYMSALSTIAEASLGKVHVDRLGVVQVSGPSRFRKMNPWDLGEYVWVFSDGEELVGESVEKSFDTPGWHQGILYTTDKVTGQVSAKNMYIEVRDSDIDTPSKAVLSLPDGTAITTLFEKTSTSPLQYNLRFNLAGAKALRVVIYSQDGSRKASSLLLMEVRMVSISSLFALEGEGDATITKVSPQRYSLRWNSSGSKILKVVSGSGERKYLVEVRPEIVAEWLIHKEVV